MLTYPIVHSKISQEMSTTFVQVPVINKTEALFERNPAKPTEVFKTITKEVSDLVATQPYVATIKTDGTCGLLCKENNEYYLMRRQDIKLRSRNYELVMSSGKIITFANRTCFSTVMFRGSGKMERTVPLYIFQLNTDNSPEIENEHIIGFTPLLHDFGEDKHTISAIDGSNGSANLRVHTTVFEGNLDIPVRLVAAADLLGGSRSIMTVEIMGSKICNRYGFKSDRHFINPHGSIVYPSDIGVNFFDYDSVSAWFAGDANNRWANVEGFVIHFPCCNRRFKLHRGHLGMENTWRAKKESGIKFILE